MTETYRLKTIEFLGRRVPVVVQSENGPCPMLAIANIMLLRNQIHLSPDAPEVTQERLLSLIAGHLLDANAREGISEDQAANMTRIIADTVELLPKLTTGIDVNVMFNDIRGFEYTDSIAIFDLLDIHLVHGWLVDPQDRETAAAIGRKSYNSLMERMVALTGRANLTPAPCQDSHQTLPGRKPPAAAAAQEEASAGDGAAVQAPGNLSGLPAQQASPLLKPEGVDTNAVPAALSSADASAAEPVSAAADSAAKPGSPPAADSSSAVALLELPEAAGRSATADEPIQSGVHAAETSERPKVACKRPCEADKVDLAGEGLSEADMLDLVGEGLSEADELDLALKLSLHGPAKSAAACGGSTAAGSAQGSVQPPAATKSPAENLRKGHGVLPEHDVAEHAAVPAVTSPHQILPETAEEHLHTEMLDHGFVVVEPEEAPGTGFERVDMPTMGCETTDSSQEDTSAHALTAATNAQQALDHQKALGPPNGVAELPAEAFSQHGLVNAEDSQSSCKAAAAADEPPASSVLEPTAAEVGISCTESNSQPAPALDERARALLAALPKPGLSEGSCAQPCEREATSPLQQHAASAGDAEQAALGENNTASEDAAGQESHQLGAAPASQGQNAQIARMGSSKAVYLIQAFLDNASSQLTEHGLVSLHQGLKPRQLAILFRNNHFNTLFKFEDALYLLVTDQGYLHEQDVVWEKLDAIDGNTVYVGSQIKQPDPAVDSAAADLQLAMQLQQQEDAEHRQRLAAQREQPGQPGQRSPAQDAPSSVPTASDRRSRDRPGPSQTHHRRGRGAYRSQRQGQPTHAAGRGSSRDCNIM